MMRGSENLGYDRGLTMFSPEGRLFQVEYALEAVKRGTLAIGIKGTDGAILVVHKKIVSKLINSDLIHKIFLIDKHVGVAISGLHADSRILTDQARIQAAIYRLNYDDDALIEYIVKKICDLKQAYSQHGGIRPFGSSLMFIGVDEKGPQLFTTSPSGTYFSWKGKAIGYKSDEAQEYLKENYDSLKNLEDLKVFALKTLIKFVDEDLDENSVEMGYVSDKDRLFKIVDKEEIKKLLDAAKD
ncbi:MAG: archaeal proteasome endopeptidase complex subunit alpha [Promethearchaeota archaeon]